MKTKKNILMAFILNLGFSLFELIGGFFTNSISIMSDSIHDLGDSISIGISYILEKKSSQKPDNKYTYGYARYSVLGSVITTSILIVSSIFVIYTAFKRLFDPVEINYNGMLIFAIVGVVVNFIAALYTKSGHSLNEKSVHLHMIEDILGWIVVLIGAIIIRFTKINQIDTLLSIVVAIYILTNAFKNLTEILDLFLEKVPKNIDIDKIKEKLINIKNISDIHHIHIWSHDGYNNYATLHAIIKNEDKNIKKEIRKILLDFDISHVTIEIETVNEICEDKICEEKEIIKHHHHH